MPGTLVLVFHPDPSRSRANAALAQVARAVPDLRVIDMHARHPGGHIDAVKDVALLLDAGRLVLQFPVQWYSTPPLLKAWQDAVLTRMYYVNPQAEGDRLAGTPVMVAATAGNHPDVYRRGGQNHYTMDEILVPLKATAHRCGLPWHPPYLVFTADKLSAEALEGAAARYDAALRAFIAATPARSKKAA